MLRRFALGAVLVSALIGCSTGHRAGTPAAPSRSPVPEPATVLAAAVTKTTGVSLSLVLTGDTPDDNLTGSYDAVHKLASITEKAGNALKITVSADSLYLGGLAEFKGKIVHLQIAKLSAKSPLALFTDALAPLTLLTGTRSVESTGPGAFAGTLDLNQVHAVTAGAQKFVEHLVDAAADKAGSVRFTATVDQQGYLAGFDATLPNIDNGSDRDYDVKFADFGTAVTVTKPTGSKVVEAPAALYTET
jgi:hypothetical protein